MNGNGHEAGGKARMLRCRQDLAPALGLDGEDPAEWDALVDAVRDAEARANRLQAILDCETGKRAPEGWTWEKPQWSEERGRWRRPGFVVEWDRTRYVWMREESPGAWSGPPQVDGQYALEAIEAADAAKESK